MRFKDFFYNNGFGVTKHNGGIIECDKGTAHDYINTYYDNEFTDKRYDNITLVEIGIHKGISLKLWIDWFVNGKIIGIDIHPETNCYPWGFLELNNTYNFNTIFNDAYSFETINMFQNESIDYLIDDGPHSKESHMFLVKNWISKIKNGGKIIIEDIKGLDYISELINNVDKNIQIEYNVYDMRHNDNSNPLDSVILEIIKK